MNWTDRTVPVPEPAIDIVIGRGPSAFGAILGMVGAGGIGVVLWEIIRGFQYAETCAVMLIIIATVTCIDLLSARIRRALV